MSEHAIQCFVCSVEFQTQEELREHTWHYQTEITTLLARLHELLAHRDLKPKGSDPSSDDDDHEWHENTAPNVSNKDSGNPAGPDSNVCLAQEPEPTKRAATTQQNTPFECTHQDCAGKKKTFTRHQDLVRHYVRHLDCNEFCPYCSTTFTKGNKYINHKCTSEGPQNQQEYTKTRVETLRANAKREMKGKRAMQAAHSGPDCAKRRKVSHSAAHGSMLQYTPSTPTVELETAAPSTNEDALQSRDTAAREPVSSHKSALVSSNHTDQSSFSSLVHHPLYWPLDSDGYDQMPEFPIPLWSLQPALLPLSSEAVLGSVVDSQPNNRLDGGMHIQDAAYQSYP